MHQQLLHCVKAMGAFDLQLLNLCPEITMQGLVAMQAPWVTGPTTGMEGGWEFPVTGPLGMELGSLGADGVWRFHSSEEL